MSNEIHCSFCGKPETPELPVIQGVEGNICKECIDACDEAVKNLWSSDNPDAVLKKPHELKAELDKYVIGQDEAKKILSVAVYNHYKRISAKSKVDIQKTNILLVGPTGSGKTYIMQTLAKILDVPIVIADATSLTEEGYVGEDVESLLEKLIKKADGDLKRAEKGIVYIDEIDKLASRTIEDRKNSRDISGEGVQQALLKIIEDSEVSLAVGDNPMAKRKVIINTKNILFVCGGAFVGLDKIVEKRLNPKKTSNIGFGAVSPLETKKSVQDMDIIQQDIIDYGFIPEFVGRIPVVAGLNPLNREDLVNILVKPKNAIIKQYQALFKIDGVKLSFHQSAIDFIVEEAMKRNIGARGLRGVIEKKMYDIMFELPKQAEVKDYTITKEMLAK